MSKEKSKEVLRFIGTEALDDYNRNRNKQNDRPFYEEESNADKFYKNIPTRTKEVLFDAQTEACNALLYNMACAGGMLIGETGTGKTTMFWRVLWFRRDFQQLNFTASDLSLQLRNMDDYKNIHAKCCNTRFLGIDDLGVEKLSEHYLDMLFGIIDFRYSNKKPILISTNLSPKAISDRYGERISDRIVEMCGDRVMALKNRRRTGGNN